MHKVTAKGKLKRVVEDVLSYLYRSSEVLLELLAKTERVSFNLGYVGFVASIVEADHKQDAAQ